MAKSPAHISLLALLLGSEPHQKALLRVLTAAQVLKETPLDRIEERIGSIFSNTISFSDDELPSEGWSHSRALHIVCKCNNYIIGQVMIDNWSTLNVCPVTTLKQMNVDLNRVSPSKTAVRAFDGSRREVNGEIDLLIDVGPCSFSITFQVLDIPNAFSLLLGRPWIHSAGAVPSSLHQRLEFIVEEKLITVKGEEDYAIYKETAVPYISIGDDENLPFHSFETISVIRDYEESGPSRADRMIGKFLLRNNYIPGIGLGARGQGISRPIEIEEYKYKRGLGFRPACHEIIEARKGNHLHRLAAYYKRLNRGTSVPPLSHFFPGPSHIIGGTLDGPSSDSDDTPAAPSAVYAVTEEIPSGVHIRLAQENEELDNWTSVSRYSAVIVDLHSNPNPRRFGSNLSREQLGEPQPVYFGEGLPEDSELNPAKCTFGARSGKLLGFVVNERGIEVDPDKVKAIKELPPPSTVREVRGFLGRLNYITRFIANLTDKCQPLFRLLRKNAAMEWDHECQKAFDTIKAYLIQPPILVLLVPSRPLILYLTVRRQSLGCMLGQEDESTRTERAIYYLSKKFTEGESNYPEIEKMCCALVWVMQRLRQYTLYHTIRLLSKADTLKYLLDSPSSTRNLAKWRCQLTEYNICTDPN
ncbi:hypothetical protein CRG98_029232, partial [Punica granatum]